MKAAPGKQAELKAGLEALIEPTSQEDGYVNYDLYQGVEDLTSLHSSGSR
nr:antibiotic biosynthesis monooxygenase [Pseudonocardia sp.]